MRENARRRRPRHRGRRRVGIAAVAAVAAASGGAWANAQDAPRAEVRAFPSAPAPERPPSRTGDHRDRPPAIRWRRSQELGTPSAGRLLGSVLLPASGTDYFTWDRVDRQRPNPPERRWGSDRLIRMLLDVLRDYRVADPGAASVGIGDLSRRHGGPFTGPSGHVSHQNGLDVDIFYPRHDRRLRAPHVVAQVDRRRAQDLIDRFVTAGAERIFVDARLALTGPPSIVQPWPGHTDHFHVRLPER